MAKANSEKPRLWCIFNANSGHWRMVNYEKHSAAVNASTAYTHGYEVHEMLCRPDVESIVRESRELAAAKERERATKLLAALSTCVESFRKNLAMFQYKDEPAMLSAMQAAEAAITEWKGNP